MQDWPNNSNVFLRKSLSADNLHAADAFLRKSLSAEILEILGASAKLVSAAVLKGTNALLVKTVNGVSKVQKVAKSRYLLLIR